MRYRLSLLLLITLFFHIEGFAQSIAVKSFRVLENDLAARTNPEIDQNGEKCALIKVVTTEKGFYWEPDMLGIVKTENHVGEIWLYVPHHAKRITIKHDQLGVLRNYVYPVTIEKATVYEMVLTTDEVKTIVEKRKIANQWLTITTRPEGATVYLNGEMQSELTPFFKKVKTGNYTYRLEYAKYHTEAGKIEVTTDKKAEINIDLRPAFGQIEVKSEPEQGAQVLLNGEPTGKNTPCTLEKVESGEHQIRVMKSMFKPAQQKVVVRDGETTPISINLSPNFAKVTIETNPKATIFIDEQNKGNDSWSGRLDAGIHTVTAKKDKHKSDKTTLELTAGDNEKIELKPTPIEGTLDVTSKPMGAKIFLDGKEYGTTPNTLRNLLIGEYEVKLVKEGFGTVIKTITIKENQTATLNENLPSGKEITITSDPAGAELYLDGEKVGRTPYTATLGFGSRKVKLVNGKKTVEENISVVQGGKTSWEFNVSEVEGIITNGMLLDTRDNEKYKIVTIGNQVWLAENLNYDAGNGCWCYDNKSDNCEKYGRLYNWETAKKACPDGWHLPTDNEWTALEEYISSQGYKGGVGNALKSTSEWKRNGKGIDGFAFNARPSGYADNYRTFKSIGGETGYWSKTDFHVTNAWALSIFHNKDDIKIKRYRKDFCFSVRCLKDN